MVHGNVTGWPATTTRSCGCWENMVSTPLKEKKKKKIEYETLVWSLGASRRWKAEDQSADLPTDHRLSCAAGVRTTRPLPPILLKPLVRIANKREFFFDPRDTVQQRCQPGTSGMRQPSQASLVHLGGLSPYRWARLTDHTFLSANTAWGPYINCSSHPCIPTVQPLLTVLLCHVFKRKSGAWWTPLEADAALMGRDAWWGWDVLEAAHQ